jgi:hypothetical protein
MKEQLDLAKTVFELFKQVLVAVILFLLVFYPASIGGALDRMGITEGDMWGLKWKKELKKTDDALQQSQADKDRLAERLKLANQTIKDQGEVVDELQSGPGGAGSQPTEKVAKVIESAKKIVDQNQTALSATQQSTQAIQRTIVSNSQLVARAQENEPQASSAWVILTGSDPLEADAVVEAQRAKAAGFAGVKVIHNRGAYRTGIIYPERQAAAAALDDVKAKTRDDAYIVSMEKWCPSRRDVRPDLIECGTQ